MHRILDAINRIDGCFAWENLSNGAVVNGRIVKRKGFQVLGSSDIIACYKGKFIALEVKTPGRRENVSDAQVAFLNKITKCGGTAKVVVSVEDALQWIG